MALLALATSAVRDRPRLRNALFAIGVFGAALFYGDAVLTPAISVLSAVEGLEVGTEALKPYVVPLSAGILIALFAIQRYGTGVVGLFFGPICAVWFVSLGAIGVWQHRQGSGDSRGPRSDTRAPLRHGSRFRVVHRARLGAARVHRGRSALRGHGTLRQAGDPRGLVRRRGARRWC